MFNYAVESVYITVTLGPMISGCNREVAALKSCAMYGVLPLAWSLNYMYISGCNKRVAVL